MPRPAVDSCFDVAFWLLDRSLDDGEYLQPQKLHRIMYLAQAYFAASQSGAKLMPATFIITEEGPVEPTIYRAMERGRPMVDTLPLPKQAEHVLDSVWRQFGAKSVDRLSKSIRKHPPVMAALDEGVGSEISFEAMTAFYSQTMPKVRRGVDDAPIEPEAPPAEAVLRPKVMRSHTGKPVSVNQWSPRRVE